ncbi:MAG: DEAD/DEAH box helicase family protein [Rikenellaceae bacterium]
MENIETLDRIIIGRVEPHIYAFSTETVPNYLKVGDTYRPVEVRLDEWRKYFPNLEKQFSGVAKVNDEVYFRDYAVHQFLLNERCRKRLLPGDITNLEYYSKEFFENSTIKDIEDSILDIKEKYAVNDTRYQYYKFDDSLIPKTYVYTRLDDYPLRPNQDATVKKFRAAIDNGRTNLLMYAVMRFGKSFTSLCCAVEMEAKLVVVVSAKADVREEWKKTTQSHVKFSDYEFVDSDALLRGDLKLDDRLKNSNLVLFLTLQDLQGSEIKKKHKDLFENEIDLLIVDETHFGARSSEFGKVLRDFDYNEYMIQQKELQNEDKSYAKFEETKKSFNAKVKLHLSGTPYKILMGSEFTPEDIIAFYQFSDIVKD